MRVGGSQVGSERRHGGCVLNAMRQRRREMESGGGCQDSMSVSDNVDRVQEEQRSGGVDVVADRDVLSDS